jgi:putative phage-type endonuclease
MKTTTEAEFREQRRRYVGGSDIAAILGLSPWKTNVDLWADKVRPPSTDNANRKVKSRGKRWESVVAEMLVEELHALGHTVEIVNYNVRYIDPQCEHFACEIDFEIRLDGLQDTVNVELKTVHPFKAREWGDSGSDDLPTYYTAQAMWGLGITGRRQCIVAPLFGADEIKTFPVVRDEETIAGMRARALRFWNEHVIANVAPEPVELTDLDKIFPKAGDRAALVADEELTGKILRLRAIDKSIKAQQAEYEAIEFEVKRAMRDAPEIEVRGKSAITWKEREFSFLDQQALREEFPKIHRALTRKSTSRVFSLKSFAWDR